MSNDRKYAMLNTAYRHVDKALGEVQDALVAADTLRRDFGKNEGLVPLLEAAESLLVQAHRIVE